MPTFEQVFGIPEDEWHEQVRDCTHRKTVPIMYPPELAGKNHPFDAYGHAECANCGFTLGLIGGPECGSNLVVDEP